MQSTSTTAQAVASPTVSATAQSQHHVEVADTTETIMPLACIKCGGTMTPVKLHVVAYMYFSRHLQGLRPPPRGPKRVKAQFYGEAMTSDEVFQRVEEAEKAKAKAIEEKEERQRIRAEKAALQKEKKKSKKQKKGAVVQQEMSRRCDSGFDEEINNEEDEMEKQRCQEKKIVCSDSGDECEVCGGSYDDDSEKRKKAWIGCDGCDRWFHFWCAGYKRKPSTRSQFLCYACKPRQY